ncbi:polyprenol monophosphomannose synthase [Acidicapsa dinghuensis]|uniref:Polyprenol monophosphomannose synthase n=2 Tax=Acidicapsa dinghuensis TaxID=2218256 RepID=A0ABW1EL82_9BACT
MPDSVSAPAQKGRERAQFALVIPTLCEAGNILELLEEVRNVLDSVGVNYEILVVDDESCDGTGELVKRVAENDPRVRLLVRRGERGLSGAILHGWRHSDADVLGVMDADRQHPPALLPQLLQAILNDRDVAIGSRYTKGGETGQWNLLRRLWSSMAVSVTLPLQQRGIRAKDPMSGYFLVRRTCLGDICFEQSGFKLLLEILVRGRISSIQEIPFAFGQRASGTSKANLRVARDFASLLLKLYANRLQLSGLKEQTKTVRNLPEAEEATSSERVTLRR